MSRPTRALLLVENNTYPGDFRVRREALALHEAGCEVSVVAPRGAEQPWHEEIDGVHVYRFPATRGGRGVFGYALEFACATLAILLLSFWVAARRGVDVVHAANPPDTLWIIGLFFKVFGRRFVYDHHDLAPEIYLSRFAQPRKSVVYKCLLLLERCSFAVADVVVCANESYRSVATTRGRKDSNRVFVVRNGPPLSYRPLVPDNALVSRAKFLIGYVGTIGPQDGLDVWLRAIRIMVSNLGRTDFLAVVIGDGDAYAEVRALARRLQIEPYVHFTGRLPESEARKYLSAVNVCVQPDPSSPLNDRSTMNKLMEYMALGKPTVAFDLHETRQSAQGAALYVQPNDESAFAECVSVLLDSPEECERMGQIGMQRVTAGLAWEHSVPQLLRAYREGLGVLQYTRPAEVP